MILCMLKERYSSCDCQSVDTFSFFSSSFFFFSSSFFEGGGGDFIAC